MRRDAKVDANQKVIVSALRDAGVSVYPTHMVGRGFPDLVCGYRGVNYLLEVKDGTKPPSARQLTPDEQEFVDRWRGAVIVVEDIDSALNAVGVTYD